MNARLPFRLRGRKRKTFEGILVLAVAAGVLAGCRPPAPRLRPPAEIQSVEGYASIRLEGGGRSGKSRISFQVHLPSQGRIEVFDVLGRVLFYLIIGEQEARFVLPSKKAYWPASSPEVVAKFLGFSLSLEEWTYLVSGVWPASASTGPSDSAWTLERDNLSRVVAGLKGNIRFEAKEFFAGSPCPRRLIFMGETGRGNLTMLDLRFNVAIREASFSLDLPEGYQAKTWDEIERLLQGEN